MPLRHRVVRLSILSVLLISTAFCLGQADGSSNQANVAQTDSKIRTLAGRVVNSVTGQPIARALVQVGASHTALTDSEGHFEFDNVSADSGPAFVSKPGFFPHDEQGVPPTESMTLQLVPEAILFGTVSDQDGQPIQELPVQLKSLEVRDGIRRWQTAQGTTTNSEGEFRFAELQAGNYALATGYKIEGLQQAAASTAFLPVAYPPLAGDGVNGAIALAPGDRVEANINSTAVKLYPVTGQVTGGPERGVGFVFKTIEGEPVSPSVNFFPGGAFRAMLPSGSYRYRAYSPAGREIFFGAGEITVNGAPLNGVSIHLEPEFTIPVEIEYQIVNSQNSPPTPSVNLMMQEDDPSSGNRMYPAQTPPSSAANAASDPGGPLVFQNLEPGRYSLRPQLQSPWYVASASCGNVDLARDSLVLATGSAGCVLRVVLRNDCGSLTYSVTAGNTDSSQLHGFIAVVPLATRLQTLETNLVSAQLPAQGSFTCLAPGRYLVVATQTRQELPYRDNDAMQSYLSLGQQVSVTPNGKTDVQLKLLAAEP